jgi:hypothetical protein
VTELLYNNHYENSLHSCVREIWKEIPMKFSYINAIVLLVFYTIFDDYHSCFDLEAPITHTSFKPDAASLASSIKYHAEFTPLFSPERFELPKAFFATAQTVRDALIINWNATYDYHENLNAKQAYYLSMEFLQVCLGVFCIDSHINNTFLSSSTCRMLLFPNV